MTGGSMSRFASGVAKRERQPVGGAGRAQLHGRGRPTSPSAGRGRTRAHMPWCDPRGPSSRTRDPTTGGQGARASSGGVASSARQAGEDGVVMVVGASAIRPRTVRSCRCATFLSRLHCATRNSEPSVTRSRSRPLRWPAERKGVADVCDDRHIQRSDRDRWHCRAGPWTGVSYANTTQHNAGATQGGVGSSTRRSGRLTDSGHGACPRVLPRSAVQLAPA